MFTLYGCTGVAHNGAPYIERHYPKFLMLQEQNVPICVKSFVLPLGLLFALAFRKH